MTRTLVKLEDLAPEQLQKGDTREVIIEKLKTASSYRVTILPKEGETEFVFADVVLSGVQAGQLVYRKNEKTGAFEEVAVDPSTGAFEARAWIMPRILNKQLTMKVEGFQMQGKTGNTTKVITASLLHPVKGSIAEFLLEEGLGAYVAWSAEGSVSGPEKLKKSEDKARALKKGRFREGRGGSSASANVGKEFSGKVIEIVSGDQIRIMNLEDRIEKRYYVASLRKVGVAKAN